MKNLENYGVQSLNAKEIRETDGGWDWSKAGYEIGYFFNNVLVSVVEGSLPYQI